MDNENETQPLLPSFEAESWRSRTRKRCMRIPSEITITGIILGLFLIVVTLLIVLEDMETEKKGDISLDKKLLASPFKFDKGVADKSWQDAKAMKLANKDRKMDKIIKGWKISPEITDSSFKFNKNVEDQSWQAKKEMQMKNKERKLDKINKGWKQIPSMLGKTINLHNDESIEGEKNGIKTLGNLEMIHDYGKEVDDSFEAISEPEMRDPSVMQKFNEDVLEIKRLLHSSVIWKVVDEGWKTLSEQGWKDREIRRALSKALNEKWRELMTSEYIQSAPVSLDEMWDNIIESWKKNLNKGKGGTDDEDDAKGNKEAKDEMSDEESEGAKGNKIAEHHKSINDDWKNKMNMLQSPKSSIKNFIKNDDGWQKLSEQGWKNKDIEEAIVDAWQEKNNLQLQQSPMGVPSMFGKTTDFFKSLFPKAGADQQKSQMTINDKWANKFNSLQSPMFSSKKAKKGNNKQSENGWKVKTTDTIPTETVQEPHIPISFEIIIELIIASIRDQQIGNEEVETQTEVKDQLNTEVSHASKFGRKDDDVTLGPNVHKPILQNSMPFDEAKWKKVNNGWKTIMDPALKDKILTDAVDKAWQNGDKLMDSAMGFNDMKWKKVNNGWKKISNNS